MITLDQLSQLGIGTSRVGSLGSRLSPESFSDFLKVASSHHLNLIDTSNYYGSGDAERLIRKGMKASGAPFFVVTKAGLPCVHAPGWLSPLNQLAKKVKQKTGSKKNYTAAYLIDSLQKSNRRLGVDAADGFLLHEPVWTDLADADSWDGLQKIRQQGLARYTGVSTSDYRVVEEGIRSGQVQFVQTSACWTGTESDEIIKLCQANHVPVLANQVLRPYKSLQSKFELKADEIRRLEGLADISLAQLLIAAVLVDKNINVALFGTSDLAHLEHNMGALHYTKPLAKHLPIINKLLA
ncbi:aldo/keto reductase [Spirosoma agri]|uniref:Aldo/keto reductase n=1 Tax=Spirosoma agri TaxID=1987381 RepID=A0A6M0IMQ1_9BACT|nr:aldo/keto reductase [Spirosoma agri]NEU69569.1 aldo/keto reductase [Spirosoma agri]